MEKESSYTLKFRMDSKPSGNENKNINADNTDVFYENFCEIYFWKQTNIFRSWDAKTEIVCMNYKY